MGDEEDRRTLLAMNEIDREQILAKRHEIRQERLDNLRASLFFSSAKKEKKKRLIVSLHFDRSIENSNS